MESLRLLLLDVSFLLIGLVTFSVFFTRTGGRTTILLFTLGRDYTAFLGTAVLLGLATGIAGASPAAYAADLAPARHRGGTIGLYRTFGDMGFVIGPILLGWVADLSSYATALRLNAALLFVSGLLFLLFARETVGGRRRAAEPVRG